jgi:hypothetical protein
LEGMIIVMPNDAFKYSWQAHLDTFALERATVHNQ